MSELNLLPSEAKFQAERMRLKVMITNFLWIFGGIWLSVVIVILSLNLIKQLSLNQLNKKYKKVADQYKVLAGNMSINQKVRYQAKVVAKVLGDRFEYGESMEKVKNIFSDKITIGSIQITGIKQYIIYGSVSDGVNMDEVEEKVDDINGGKIEGFKFAKIKSIETDKLNGWKFTLEVVLL